MHFSCHRQIRRSVHLDDFTVRGLTAIGHYEIVENVGRSHFNVQVKLDWILGLVCLTPPVPVGIKCVYGLRI